MPGRKGTKALQERNAFLGMHAKNKGKISACTLTLQLQSEEIEKLEQKVRYKRNRIRKLKKELEEGDSINPAVAISMCAKNCRLTKPTGSNICKRTKQTRCNETFEIAQAIHGGSCENNEPTINGLLTTLTSKCKSETLAKKVLDSKPSLINAITNRCIKIHTKSYYNSEENKIRSLNVYYSHCVMGKLKYISMRKANKSSSIPNFVPYSILSSYIRSIDIGYVSSIKPKFTHGLDEEEIGDGMYRNLLHHVPRLAQFYLTVNQQRIDKLKFIDSHDKKDESSFMFVIAIGGDEAPASGTSFLLSFLNLGKRIASSFENYLIFGANVKENSIIVRKYISELVSQLKTLENEVLTLTIKNVTCKVEFKVDALSNDMKMLAFLAGELTNSAYYFTTFGNVNQYDVNDYKKLYSATSETAWKPFSYKKRCSDAAKVSLKKVQLAKKGNKPKTVKTAITNFISKELHSRQEELPLVEEYIGCAKCEPLHLKNNINKEMFIKVKKVVILEANLPKNIQTFSELPTDNLFHHFVTFLREGMNCNYLSNKVVKWFNENMGKQAQFAFRFRGKESSNYLKYFLKLISTLIRKIPNKSAKFRLITIYYQSLQLRKLVSYSVRIEEFTNNDVQKMKRAAKNLFKSCCLFDCSVSPSLWVLTNVAPVHAVELFSTYGVGLGINTMEGREQKHQKIEKYSEKAIYQDRWQYIFRHEYIQLVYLHENGFDTVRYRKRVNQYIPDKQEGQCDCSLALDCGVCAICDSERICTKYNRGSRMLDSID